MAFNTLQKNVTTSGTPVQLSADAAVQAGIPICIKAKSANTGTITVGPTSAKALNSGVDCFRLGAGAALEIRVANLNEVYIDSTVNGEGVEVIHETII